MLLHDSIKYWSSNSPDKIALITDGKFFSYKGIWSIIQNFAFWISTNTKKYARVGILLENTPETVFAVYGVTMAGRICVPIDADIHERNMRYIINDCSIETIITSSMNLNKISNNGGNNIKNIILVNGDEAYLSFNKIISENNTKKEFIPDFKDDIPAFILYTTGTTGPQKGVVLSHYNLLEATKNINEFMQIDSDIVESLPMRLSHSFGFARLRSVFSVGGSVILENGFLRPERIIFNMNKYNANAISSVPAGFAIILDYYGKYFNDIGPNIRYIEIGSAFMRKDHKYLLMKYCPNARTCMHYGLTEASRATFIEFHSEKEKLHTVGKPSPNVKIKIISENKKDLGINKQGEICVKGKMVAREYLNKLEQTQNTFVDGWLLTGDIGAIDKEGYLHLLGRKKEMINVGGLKVAPGEVEEILLKYPNILEAAVVGKKSNDLNQEFVSAYIVAKDNVDTEELKKYCIANLELYKVPKEFNFIDKLPKTGSGKIQKHMLIKDFDNNKY